MTTRNDLVTTLRLSRRSFLVRSGAVSVGVAFGAGRTPGRKPQAPLKTPVVWARPRVSLRIRGSR